MRTIILRLTENKKGAIEFRFMPDLDATDETLRERVLTNVLKRYLHELTMSDEMAHILVGYAQQMEGAPKAAFTSIFSETGVNVPVSKIGELFGEDVAEIAADPYQPTTPVPPPL